MERVHAWTASHCEMYVRECCEISSRGTASTTTRQKSTTKRASQMTSPPPLTAALSAIATHHSTVDSAPQPQIFFSLWLSRICRTASHEVGYCFGLKHCGHYTCLVQGSASFTEDTRQPACLCPVDLAKLLYATKKTRATENITWRFWSM